jgi:hypothetical protein
MPAYLDEWKAAEPDNSNGTLSVYESDRGHNSLAVVKGTHPGGFAPK